MAGGGRPRCFSSRPCWQRMRRTRAAASHSLLGATTLCLKATSSTEPCLCRQRCTTMAISSMAPCPFPQRNTTPSPTTATSTMAWPPLRLASTLWGAMCTSRATAASGSMRSWRRCGRAAPTRSRSSITAARSSTAPSARPRTTGGARTGGGSASSPSWLCSQASSSPAPRRIEPPVWRPSRVFRSSSASKACAVARPDRCDTHEPGRCPGVVSGSARGSRRLSREAFDGAA
mmetsp:Transcript_76488/g.211706  ORF Transcript_76488/g.211706 Transcript_76488/m.211706 type:complete len:232 (-) Transcript_76488:104-799(-)